MTTSTAVLPSVLCVDDEPRVLDGLKLTLRRGFNVATASSGADGLAALEQLGGVAVVISDMRMPGMDGASFLTKVRAEWPDSTRLLLTGEPGRDAAVTAVNEGQVFRFLTKPCAPDKLIAAVEAGVRQYQLIAAEKILLQQTVLGSIKALVDVLAIVNPIAFGRGSRIKRMTVDLAKAAGLPVSWELEAAALMSQVGYVSLPSELVEKAAAGETLNSDEKVLLSGVPKVTHGILARIPRLENVTAIVSCATHSHAGKEALSQQILDSAAVLMNVLEFDALLGKGDDVETAIATLRTRHGIRNIDLVNHLSHLHGMSESNVQVREVRLREVVPGMILMDDLRTDLGTLLVSRGYEVSQSFVDRMRNFGPGLLDERVRVQSARGVPRQI